jgi:putative transposase
MDTELKDRKRAMLMYHVQHLSKAEICRQLGRTRPWLDRWLQRYSPDDVEGSLRDRQAGPQQSSSLWSAQIRQQVIDMRKARSQESQWRYAFIGARAIRLELEALGSAEVPPERTIHAWFVEAGLVKRQDQPAEPHQSKPIPLPVADAVNRVQQLDLKGPLYLAGCSTKYYLIDLRDRYSHRCALDLLAGREAQGIVDFLVANWRWMGWPDYLQLDNALEFRGSHRYPRSFGQVVRMAVDLGVEPLFNPPREPWRNGGVEWFNGFLDQRLLRVQFADAQALRAETKACQEACNQTHRSLLLQGLTPHEVAAKATLRFPPPGYRIHQTKDLPQDHGFVSFVRLVRKSGRITLGAEDRFMVDPALAWEYVLARVDLARQVVHISYQDQVIRSYDFSAQTVGAWADGNVQKIEPVDEVVKEQPPECNAVRCISEH